MSYRNQINKIIINLSALIFPIIAFSGNINSTIYAIDTNKTKVPKYHTENISISKSVGIWENKKDYGFFSVLVYKFNGIETTRVLIKKSLDLSTDKNHIFEILKDINIPSPNYQGTVKDMHLQIINNKLLITLDIVMRGMDGAIMQEVLLVDIYGKVFMIQKAKYVDAIGEI